MGGNWHDTEAWSTINQQRVQQFDIAEAQQPRLKSQGSHENHVDQTMRSKL